jgi:dihydrolipoamide dehydrogenase
VADEVQLPQLGESVTEGVITAWLVQVGDTVEVDQPIVEISTDKVDTEIPSPIAGVVTELRAEVDDTIEVGQVIAVIDAAAEAGSKDDGEDTDGDQESATEAGDGDDEAASEDDQGADAAAPDDGSSPADRQSTSAPSGVRERGEDHTHDVVVLGAGTGGYSVALRAAQLGLEVALVEQAKVGGTCLHWGCIPTKAILQTAEIAEHAQDAGDFGVTVDYQGIEVAALNAHKDGVVDKMWKGLQGALKGRGVETVHGTGRLTATDTVTVQTDDGEVVLKAPNVVLATGSVPRTAIRSVRRGEDHLVRPRPAPGGTARLRGRAGLRCGRHGVRDRVVGVRRRRHDRGTGGPPAPVGGRGLIQGNRPGLPEARPPRRDGGRQTDRG